MKQLIEITDETEASVKQVLDVFAGDTTAILANLKDLGFYFGQITTADPVEKDEPTNTQAEQPKEWIERQEEERRAWAINTAIEACKTADVWDQNTLINLAKEIVDYVKGESSDLNDVAATDAFYLVVGEMLEERESSDDIQLIEDFLIKVVDRLAKEGVRLKDGKHFEDEA